MGRFRVAALLLVASTSLAAAIPSISAASSAVGRVRSESTPADWIAHKFSGNGVIVSFSTPPTWTHRLVPAVNGNVLYGGPFGFLSSFALKQFCWKKKYALGCTPGIAGQFPKDGATLNLGPESHPIPDVPDPFITRLGSQVVIGGYRATRWTPNAAGYCVGKGAKSAIAYDVDLWVPSSFQMVFCVSGPKVSQMKAMADQVAQSATFAPDPHSVAAPVSWSSIPAISDAGSAPVSKLKACTASQVRAKLHVASSNQNGRTSISVTTAYANRSKSPCGLAIPLTCGTYGAFTITSPAGHKVWAWSSMQLQIACDPRYLVRLPLTVKVGKWSVPTNLLAPGSYIARTASGVPGVPPLGGNIAVRFSLA